MTDPAIEAAARAMFAGDVRTKWDEMSERAKEPFYMAARKAIAAYEVAAWRPIAEAPRDGTFVLCALRSGHITIMRFCRDDYWRRDVFSELRQTPQWFRPLPLSPPQEDERG
jgi:hypothetical protein